MHILYIYNFPLTHFKFKPYPISYLPSPFTCSAAKLSYSPKPNPPSLFSLFHPSPSPRCISLPPPDLVQAIACRAATSPSNLVQPVRGLAEALQVPVDRVAVGVLMQGEREQDLPDQAVEALGFEGDGAANQLVAEIALETRYGDLEKI